MKTWLKLLIGISLLGAGIGIWLWLNRKSLVNTPISKELNTLPSETPINHKEEEVLNLMNLHSYDNMVYVPSTSIEFPYSFPFILN